MAKKTLYDYMMSIVKYARLNNITELSEAEKKMLLEQEEEDFDIEPLW